MPSRFELANALRALSMDAVEAAKSGHPGMPMGMADIAEVLWREHLVHDPRAPDWANRDRFVLSNGHGSMLLYALLHLSGYGLSLDELKRFRQLHSKTAGHPERHATPGVETTTGPLGQGLANAVGMAYAEKLLAARFNRPGHSIIDHRTYCFIGDGCLMEGISHEACSLAGTLKLGKLIVIYDDNGISIDGPVARWFTDDTPARFRAYGWNVIANVDGHAPDAINAALKQTRATDDRPTLICCKTTIGFGAPTKAGKESAHGAPLGKDEIAGARERLGWPHAPFVVPDELRAAWDQTTRGAAAHAQWQQRFEAYTQVHPELAAELHRRWRGELPTTFADTADALIRALNDKGEAVASRRASQIVLEALKPSLPELIGGSADLTHSNLTATKASGDLATDLANGRHLSFGVREFGMSAIANGIALHGGFLPYTATFLVFSDYARNAVRMSALIPAHAIHVYTHDSIGLGEDGPTHQPVEHLAALRLIPNHDLWRPADTVESAVAWRAAIERRDGPTSLVFSRQTLKHQHRDPGRLGDLARGGYVLIDPPGNSFEVILIGTGSELELARLAAIELRDRHGIAARVVSMPSTSVFDRQDLSWRESVLPSWCRARVAVEAGVSAFWRAYVGLDGAVVGLDQFGASAPAEALYAHFGITVDAVVDAARHLVKR
jgi:transketolase